MNPPLRPEDAVLFVIFSILIFGILLLAILAIIRGITS